MRLKYFILIISLLNISGLIYSGSLESFFKQKDFTDYIVKKKNKGKSKTAYTEASKDGKTSQTNKVLGPLFDKGVQLFENGIKLYQERKYTNSISVLGVAYKNFDIEKESIYIKINQLYSGKAKFVNKKNGSKNKEGDKTKAESTNSSNMNEIPEETKFFFRDPEYQKLIIYMAISSEYIGDCYKKLKDRKRTIRNYNVSIQLLYGYLAASEININDPKYSEDYQNIYQHIVRIQEKLQYVNMPKVKMPYDDDFRVGMAIGTNIGWASGQIDMSPKPRLLWGVIVEFPLPWLRIEEQDVWYDFASETTFFYLDSNNNNGEGEVRTDFIQFRPALKARLLTRFFVAPTLALGFTYTWVLSSFIIEPESGTKTDYRQKQNRGYFSLQPSVGFDFPVWIGILNVEFGLDVGLTSLAKKDYTYQASATDPVRKVNGGSQRNFMIMTGYRIGF